MKKILIAFLCFGIVVIACKKNSSVDEPKSTATHSSIRYAQKFVDTTDVFDSRFIPITVANGMISSYLYSINYTQNDSDLKSFSVDADSLRQYLSNSSVKKVKLMFAHTEGYMKAGNTGVYAGYQSGALTIVIAGCDSDGNYIYNNGMVLEHLVPCPYTCPGGTASGFLLQ